MKKKKYSLFNKGDIILTNPEEGYYGIAVVLDDGLKLEIEPGKWSYPMCHIAITPLIFDFKPTMNDLEVSQLKPLVFMRCFALKDQPERYRDELLVHIYTNRNVLDLPIIGNIDPINVYKGKMSWEPEWDKFHLCGDIGIHFGREAYIQWLRNNK